jgi:hypothetical protein
MVNENILEKDIELSLELSKQEFGKFKVSDYHQCSVKGIITNIDKFFLSPLQRKFEWDENKIIGLFNSLYRGIPLGTLFFIEISKSDLEINQSFYQFSSNQGYKEHMVKHSQESISPDRRKCKDANIISVIDGQQRITSLLVGVQGTYGYYKGSRYPKNLNLKSSLCFNLESESFTFLTSDQICENHIKVSEIFNSDNYQDDERLSVKRLYEAINKDKTISFWCNPYNRIGVIDDITGENTLANLFITLNDGKPLRPINLVFALLTGDGTVPTRSTNQDFNIRNQFELLVSDCRKQGFYLDELFLLKAFLYINGFSINNIISSFSDKKNESEVNSIKDDIANSFKFFRDCILKTLQIFEESNYNNSIGPANGLNFLFPVILYVSIHEKIDDLEREEIRKFAYICQINKLFSGGSFKNLNSYRNKINPKFESPENSNVPTFFEFIKTIHKDLRIDFEKAISNNSFCTLLLSIIQKENSNTGRGYKFPSLGGIHLDHLHPQSAKNESKEDKTDFWFQNYNSLPNFALLDCSKNESKNASKLVEYVSGQDDENFIESRLIPTVEKVKTLKIYKNQKYQELFDFSIKTNNDLLDFKNFELFYKARKEMLAKELYKFFEKFYNKLKGGNNNDN